MMHRLDDVVFFDLQDEDFEYTSENNCVKKIFKKVFENLDDMNGLPLKDRAKFKDSYHNILEKCTIENSMEIVYNLINKHIPSQENVYFKDDSEKFPSPDIIKIIEFLNYLHEIKVPKKFVGGFLLLIVKFVYFPLPVA